MVQVGVNYRIKEYNEIWIDVPETEIIEKGGYIKVHGLFWSIGRSQMRDIGSSLCFVQSVNSWIMFEDNLHIVVNGTIIKSIPLYILDIPGYTTNDIINYLRVQRRLKE